MKNIRFLLDENVNPILRSAIISREPEIVVWKIGDPAAPPKGMPDPEILHWCEENEFLLVTNNRKSIPGHVKEHLSSGHHFPGIIELHPNMTAGEIAEELILIWHTSGMEEYRDLIIYLPVL